MGDTVFTYTFYFESSSPISLHDFQVIVISNQSNSGMDMNLVLSTYPLQTFATIFTFQ